MKEYIAETGGRYTYSDDILNLQELALSMSAVFDSCSDFIISGCEPDGPRISPDMCGSAVRSAVLREPLMPSILIIFTRPTGMSRWSMPMMSTNADVLATCVPERRPYLKRPILLRVNCL